MQEPTTASRHNPFHRLLVMVALMSGAALLATSTSLGSTGPGAWRRPPQFRALLSRFELGQAVALVHRPA